MSGKGAYGDERFSTGPPEFHSQDERDAWQIRTYGRVKNAFREPDEPADGRPEIKREPFYRDQSEQLTYEHAAETNPRRAGESPLSYIARLASIAAGRIVPRSPVGSMPRAKPSKADLERKVRELEGQRDPE